MGSDFDRARGTLRVSKARVAGIDKDSTKTGEARTIFLCPRTLAVLERHLVLRAELVRAGRIPPGSDFAAVCGRLTSREVQWEHADPAYDELYPDAAR